MGKSTGRKTEENCESCELAVAIGTSIRVCKSLGDKKTCKELEKKILNEEITPDQVFRTVRKLAKGHKEELEMMDIVDEFMRESKHGKTKRKKKKRSR